MPEWQERITRDTHPAIRIEHELRYVLAAPLIRESPVWLELGCGEGIAAAAALGGDGPPRAVLVDAGAEPLEQAAREVPAGDVVPVQADLSGDAGLAAVRTALGEGRDGTATCFEVIEHLESFVGVVELLVELATERGFTVLLSVPNDAFWPIESPWHKTMWGEGSFEELRRLLPTEHVVAHQVPLQGSSIVPKGAEALDPPRYQVRAEAVPSHMLAAFGPRREALVARSAVAQADLEGQRRWERQREANLALYEDHIRWADGELAKRRF